MAQARRRSASNASAGSPASSGASELDAILDGDSNSKVTVLRRSREGVRAEASQLAEQIGELGSMSAEERAAVFERILNADIEAVRSALPQDESALGELVEHLDASFGSYGEEFARVQEFNDAEKAVKQRAEDALNRATVRLTAAGTGIVQAENALNIPLLRPRAKAIAAAKAELQAAETNERLAQDSLREAESKASALRSKRLQTAQFRDSYARIIACVDRTKEVLAERIDMIAVQADESLQKKQESYRNKLKAAENKERKAVEVAELQNRYEQAVSARDQSEVGTAEHAKADLEVSELKREYENVKADHDRQLMVFQSMQKATEALEVEETGLRMSLHSHKLQQAKIIAESSVWLVEFKNMEQMIQSLASIEASGNLSDVGTAVQRSIATKCAEGAIATLDRITRQAEQHPGELKDLKNIRHALVEGLGKLDERWAVVDQNAREAGEESPTDTR